METTYHRPVLLDQTIEALGIRPDGIYLDGTAGGGGHSYAIASRLTTGRLISLDQDPEKWIIALSEIVDDAEQTLDTLKRLRETLDLLSEELEDTKWALNM